MEHSIVDFDWVGILSENKLVINCFRRIRRIDWKKQTFVWKLEKNLKMQRGCHGNTHECGKSVNIEHYQESKFFLSSLFLPVTWH